MTVLALRKNLLGPVQMLVRSEPSWPTPFDGARRDPEKFRQGGSASIRPYAAACKASVACRESRELFVGG
jgi:hypothetical protein